jgi:hypothetical protein
MNVSKCRLPDAIGETISFGMPKGSACIAAEASTPPSAPPSEISP